MMRRDPASAPDLWGASTTPDTPNTPDDAQVTAPEEGVRAPSGADRAREPAPPPARGGEVAVTEDQDPVKIRPSVGEFVVDVWRAEFLPPQIWSEDRPSLKKQYTYAREGAWGPKKGWARKAALACFWAVSFPTSIAAYSIEWVGERPTRWITALVLLSLTYQLPYVPEVLGVLVRVPAWPLTATWSALGLTTN